MNVNVFHKIVICIVICLYVLRADCFLFGGKFDLIKNAGNMKNAGNLKSDKLALNLGFRDFGRIKSKIRNKKSIRIT